MAKRQNSSVRYASYTYNHYDDDAIKHLFNVTSGIDSMVIGENEILGQVKNAFNCDDQYCQDNAQTLIRVFI